MKSFIAFTFLMLGLVFYEMSDGADFTPDQLAMADTGPAPEIVTRRASEDGLTLGDRLASLSTRAPSPSVMAVVSPAVLETELEPVLAVAEPEIVEIEPEVVAVVDDIPADLRSVAGTRVNMRDGPGTNFDVLVTLDGGTTTEVLFADGTGWVRIRVVDTGLEGWMAERLLTPSNG